MRKQIVMLIGGVVILMISALVIYVDTGSFAVVVDVLRFEQFRRVGISVPFGYLFILLGLVGIVKNFLKKTVSQEGKGS